MSSSGFQTNTAVFCEHLNASLTCRGSNPVLVPWLGAYFEVFPTCSKSWQWMALSLNPIPPRSSSNGLSPGMLELLEDEVLRRQLCHGLQHLLGTWVKL